MTSRRDVLISGAAIASSMLAGCSAPSDPRGDGPSGPVEVKKSDVPVGGGVVIEDRRVVVTQPEEGTFLAFSARCTHADCIVKDVRTEGIFCACHGSVFNPTDGQPTQGPATEPLVSLLTHETGDTVTVEV